MKQSNTKKTKKQKTYIQKYKELKSNGMILWNVKGKRTDKGLTRWTKQKINKAYVEYHELGGKTGIYYPRKKNKETPLGYVRRINRIKRNSGIAQTDISGILFQSELSGNLKVKNETLYIKKDLKDGTALNTFIPINRVAFNIDPERYLKALFKEKLENRKFSKVDHIVPIHSHWVGKGTLVKHLDDKEKFINKIVEWAYQYGNNVMEMKRGGDKKEIKQAIAKYDNFITGLMLETKKKKKKKKKKRK